MDASAPLTLTVQMKQEAEITVPLYYGSIYAPQVCGARIMACTLFDSAAWPVHLECLLPAEQRTQGTSASSRPSSYLNANLSVPHVMCLVG